MILLRAQSEVRTAREKVSIIFEDIRIYMWLYHQEQKVHRNMNVKGVSHKVSDGNVIGQWKAILVLKWQETWTKCWLKRRKITDEFVCLAKELSEQSVVDAA